MILGEFMKLLAACGFPQQGNPGMLGGGGIGLKALGVLQQTTVTGSVSGTTSNTQVLTDTIPANTIQAGSCLEVEAWMTKTGTGTCAVRIFVTDGTNTIQTASGTSSAGAMGLNVSNELVMMGSVLTSTTNAQPTGISSVQQSAALNPALPWTVQYDLQQSVSTDTSTINFRRIKVSNK